MFGVWRRESGPNAQGLQLQQRCADAARASWVANGDYIAHIYTGTGALGGGRSKLIDAAKTTKRALQNTWLGTYSHSLSHSDCRCRCRIADTLAVRFSHCTVLYRTVGCAQFVGYTFLLDYNNNG